MHESHEFLRNLALVLGVAALTTVVCQRLRLPVVFGYMLAGLIIGPHVPIPLVADEGLVRTLSELGVILLMFSLGLEFSIRRLLKGGWAVVLIAVLESSFMLWLGYEAGRLLGWSVLASLYAGAAIAISSTTIILKATADQRSRGRTMDLVFGILIIEDLIAILLLALLTPAATQAPAAAASLGVTVFRLVAVLAGVLVLGMLLVPRFMRFVVRQQRPEITLVVSVGICFTTALLVQSIGYSVALGAFLAGSLVAESGEEKVIERLIEPVRDMFAAIFFVSVGMMIDPGIVAQHSGAIAAFSLIVIVGKIGAVSVASFLTGSGVKTAVQTGMTMAQIGEFAFIIAAAGLAAGVTPPSHYPIVVAVSALTTLGARVVERTGLEPFQAHAAIVGGAMLLSIPFLVGIFRTGRVLGHTLSCRAFPEPEPKKLDLAAAPRRAMVVAIQLTTVLVVGAPLVAVTQPFLPPFAGVSVLLAGLVVLGLLFWRTAADLQGHVKAAAEAIVSALGSQNRSAAPREAERTLERAYELLPGLGEPVPVRIDATSPFAGRQLSDTNLRGRTGATVIAISRGAEVVLVPDGHQVLRAGDVLALAGPRQAIDAARHLLANGEESSSESTSAPLEPGAL